MVAVRAATWVFLKAENLAEQTVARTELTRAGRMAAAKAAKRAGSKGHWWVVLTAACSAEPSAVLRAARWAASTAVW